MQREADSWNKLTEKSIKEARANANAVRKEYGDVKLSRIPENTKEAGKMYMKRVYRTNGLGTFIGGPIVGASAQASRMASDRKIAEYFRENQ